MRNAVHQVAVAFAAQLPQITGPEGVSAVVDGRLAGDGLFQKGIRVPHGVPGRGVDEPLAHEPCHRHGSVRRYDDAVSGTDILLGQRIPYPVRAVRLDLDREAAGLGGPLQGLGGQIGVGNAGGAGGHAQQAVARFIGSLGRRCCRVILRLALGHRAAKGLRGHTLAQACAEICIEKQGGQFSQHLHMQVVGLSRGGDHHQHLQRFAVRCVAGQRRVQRQGRQPQPLDGGAFGMGNGKAVAHADTAQRQPGADIRSKCGGIRQILGAVKQGDQLLDRTLQRVCPLVQCDTLRPQIIGDAHGHFLH